MAQVTTLPVLVIPFVLSGLLIPVAMLPGPLRGLAQVLPLTPVMELMRVALTGTAAGGHPLGLAATFSAPVSHTGACAHRLDSGGRVGGTTLVPLGTTALGRRDALEG